MMKSIFGFFAHRAGKDPMIPMVYKQKKSFIAVARNLLGRPGELAFFPRVPKFRKFLDFLRMFGGQVVELVRIIAQVVELPLGFLFSILVEDLSLIHI